MIYCCLLVALSFLLATFFTPSNFSTLTDLEQPAMASQWTDGFAFKWSAQSYTTADGQKFSIRKTTFGTFPQSYVGDELNETLNGYNKTETRPAYLKASGKTYDIGGIKLNEYQVATNKMVTLYQGVWEIGEDRYVQVGTKWFKVQPVEWVDVLSSSNKSNVRTIITQKILYTCEFSSKYSTNYSDSILKATLSNFLDSADVYVWKDEVVQSTEDGHAYTPTTQQLSRTWSYFTIKMPEPNQYMFRRASATAFADAIHDQYYSRNSKYTSGAEYAPWWTATANTSLRDSVTAISETGSSTAYGISLDCGVRPVLNISTGTKQNTYSSFDDAVSTDSSDPDIYRVGRYEYHIKSFYGLRLLSSYTNNLVNSDDTKNEIYSTMKFYLDNNIDCGGKAMLAIKNFSGVFDGQNYSISNLNITGDYAGFIGECYGGDVKNLHLLNVNIDGIVAGAVMGKAYAAPPDVFYLHPYAPTSYTSKSSVISNVLFEGGYIHGKTISGGFAGLCGGASASASLAIYKSAVHQHAYMDTSTRDRPEVLTAAFVGMGISDTVTVYYTKEAEPTRPSITDPGPKLSTAKVTRYGSFYIENSYVLANTTPYSYSSNCGATFLNAYHTYTTIDAVKHGGPFGYYDWGTEDVSDVWVRYGYSDYIGPVLRDFLSPEISQSLPAQSQSVLLSKLSSGFNVLEVTEDMFDDSTLFPKDMPGFDLIPDIVVPKPPPSIIPTG